MRYLTLILALAGLLAMCISVSGMPTTGGTNANTPNTHLTNRQDATPSLPIPDPASPTYKTELNIVVTYARNATSPPPYIGNKECGQYTIMDGGLRYPTYTTSPVYYCQNVVEKQAMHSFMDWYCGFCVVFDKGNCQGDIRWSGGPTKKGWGDSHEVKGSGSYFCY